VSLRSSSFQVDDLVITNHHVIEDCIGVDHELTIALPYEDPVDAVIV
jgi:hypothetical protein